MNGIEMIFKFLTHCIKADAINQNVKNYLRIEAPLWGYTNVQVTTTKFGFFNGS